MRFVYLANKKDVDDRKSTKKGKDRDRTPGSAMVEGQLEKCNPGGKTISLVTARGGKIYYSEKKRN